MWSAVCAASRGCCKKVKCVPSTCTSTRDGASPACGADGESVSAGLTGAAALRRGPGRQPRGAIGWVNQAYGAMAVWPEWAARTTSSRTLGAGIHCGGWRRAARRTRRNGTLNDSSCGCRSGGSDGAICARSAVAAASATTPCAQVSQCGAASASGSSRTRAVGGRPRRASSSATSRQSSAPSENPAKTVSAVWLT
eukprot:scaffold9121_cov124-Isochrysis_galbana.AAC.3